ncbi:1,4-benzoquinone reductase [Hyaloraphidium curvatum]|nr:1,4-benzoquinone reductase [Hyaloraphidium curvatum]
MANRAPKCAIVIYSLYGHIAKMAEAVKAGVESVGGTDILQKMGAPPKVDYPILAPNDLAEFDAFIFGIPTRYGNFPAQFKAFWDATGQLWAKGSLAGRYAAVFVSTATLGGGQEQTAANAMSTFAHHGIIYVPLGYSKTPNLRNTSEVHGGSAWGAGTIASSDGSRQPSKLELEMAFAQGAMFWKTISRVDFDRE